MFQVQIELVLQMCDHFPEISERGRADSKNNAQENQQPTLPDKDMVHMKRMSFRTNEDANVAMRNIEVHKTVFLDDQDYYDDPSNNKKTDFFRVQENENFKFIPVRNSKLVTLARGSNSRDQAQQKSTSDYPQRYRHEL